VFLRVLTSIPLPATLYRYVEPRMVLGGPYNGLFFEQAFDVPADKFDELPWEDEDHIRSAVWTVPAAYSVCVGRIVHENRVSLGITDAGILYVSNPYGNRPSFTTTLISNLMDGELDFDDPSQVERRMEDAMVESVLEELTAGGWLSATETLLKRGVINTVEA
jgi:hypothetical protein